MPSSDCRNPTLILYKNPTACKYKRIGIRELWQPRINDQLGFPPFPKALFQELTGLPRRPLHWSDRTIRSRRDPQGTGTAPGRVGGEMSPRIRWPVMCTRNHGDPTNGNAAH